MVVLEHEKPPKKRMIMINYGQKRHSKTTKTTMTSLAESLTSIASDDLLLEIFTRLPNSRAACHCAAVCRRWRSVISHQQFVSMFKRHHQRRRRQQRPDRSLPFTLLFQDYHAVGILSSTILKQFASREFFSDESKKLHGPDRSVCKAKYLEFLPPGSAVRASCKDLLLVQLPAPKRMCICNPLTRQWVPLPEPPVLGPEDRIVREYLLLYFNIVSDYSIHGYAFVCDPSSEQNYKVLVINASTLRMIRAAVFRSETGRWDESVWTVPLDDGLYPLPVAVGTSDGVIYTLLRHQWALEKIAAFDPFDVSNGLGYREVSLPAGFMRGWRASCVRACVGVVRGRLRLWQAYWDSRVVKFVFKTWRLNKKYDDWVLLHDLMLTTRDESKFTETSTVMALHPDDDDVFFFNNYGPHIWQYCIRTGSCEKIGQINEMRHTAAVYTVVHQPWPTAIPQLHSI